MEAWDTAECLTALRMLLTAKNDAAKDGGSTDAEEPWRQVICVGGIEEFQDTTYHYHHKNMFFFGI